ncbi:uncharacterized methyltransferase At1g78140, chloroplastic-like [Phoenix dactylifera]|uniref:Uncharacterized methyltransferase At1g78140, chloroplastic-like n=1 Tax=Phoenix dactylifera TaxID=42345 RepID=A0A8B7CWT1_PHODC|nr:uncharacterized methyltransferase At1g78140, chloroplastic-like [Phoenix dactylifera]
MAAAVGSLRAFVPRRCLRNRGCPSAKPPLSVRIRASSSVTASVEANPVDPIPDAKVSTGMNNLGCPVCYYPLISKSNASQTVASPAGSDVECHICKKDYFNNGIYLDLTVSSGSKEYTETVPAGTELFRSQLVSFLYERGWRQNFIWGGFPGPQREFEMAKVYLTPTIGGTIVDASCGSGLFSRLFAESGMYSLVVALDFSENMLLQCDEFIKQKGISKENLILVRADISRLPFISSSIDAVHAGAALHCWPSPSTAVAEISRVLRPGGVFVATTFVLDTIPPAVPIFRAIRELYTRTSGQHLYLSEGELEDICSACGLIGFTRIRNGSFIMISATKPG